MNEFFTTLSAFFTSLTALNAGDYLRFFIAYLLIVWMAIAFWVVRDATARSNSLLFHVFAMLLILVGTPIFGLPLYWILRPDQRLDEMENLTLIPDPLLAGYPPLTLMTPSVDLVPVIVYVPRTEIASMALDSKAPLTSLKEKVKKESKDKK